MKGLLKDKALLYYHLEWILMHPRFGILMFGFILLSFTHNRLLAIFLFAGFMVELICRISIMAYKTRTNPYRSSLNRKVDGLFLALDMIGIASLLITIFDIPMAAEDAALARLLRAVYLLRTLRVFRYIDLQSAMYSPTYGMFISLVVLISFFATDTLMWIVIIFFSVELALRFFIMRSMKFKSNKDKWFEWGFWWLDVIATLVMIPAFAVIPYGGFLRMMRLVRLLRPWLVIIRNLKDVMREGQYMQEINLIVLVLAVISIAGGVLSGFLLTDFDFTQDGKLTELDKSMLAHVWFAFRLFTDPGNAVFYPDSSILIVYSVIAVVIGVFIFAFFIGIGSSIVSGLMEKLRNERLMVTNHMIMLGWNHVSPYVIVALRMISERSFSKLKLVLLHHEKRLPDELLEEQWVTYRFGDPKQRDDLLRVNAPAARQALLNMPSDQGEAEVLSETFYSLMALRSLQPDIYLSVAMPGMAEPKLKEHQHMLQVGWDNHGLYNKPTVTMSMDEFKANALMNIVNYADFDQIMNRLMIPERAEESAMQVCEWKARLTRNSQGLMLSTPGGQASGSIFGAAKDLVERGATLLAVVDENWQVHPLYLLGDIKEMQVLALVGVALNENALYGEMQFAIRHTNAEVLQQEPLAIEAMGLALPRVKCELRILVTGWMDSLPLLISRLAQSYSDIELVVMDNLSAERLNDEKVYVSKCLKECMDAGKEIKVSVQYWDFIHMEALRPYVQNASHVFLSRPQDMSGMPYAMVTTVLSHLMSLIKTESVAPVVFPVLMSRDQARLLQHELERFDLPTEVHILVPDEFYGTYVAHTGFHMYTSEDDETYQMKRVLRHVISDLMSDVDSNQGMCLSSLKVTDNLPIDAAQLYAALLAQGYVWIGFSLSEPFHWSDPLQSLVHLLFPRESDFNCMHQHKIIINPFGNPVSRKAWLDQRENITELIVVAENIAD